MILIWSPLALERVSEIGEYIGRDKPIAARNWIEKVFAKVGQLKDSLGIGRVEIVEIHAIYINLRTTSDGEKNIALFFKL